ncbi:unnamed protein product [Prorocentrum cordatum]|uniref:Uncharacterized protein n=1 Tax=Prorocentrum cordatum TaxID=2364126 RepID=A0ABN9VB19_9DINO|nr:unnamed protein product [Polarella glacialis]
MLELLAAGRADLAAADHEGVQGARPLHVAAARGHRDVAEVLRAAARAANRSSLRRRRAERRRRLAALAKRRRACPAPVHPRGLDCGGGQRLEVLAARAGDRHVATQRNAKAEAAPMADAPAEREAADARLQVPMLFSGGILVLTVAGKVGDAAAPVLVADWPVALLALNANDLHCGLTSASVPLALVRSSAVRRLAEDPLFFFLGWRYRDRALGWLRRRSPGAADGLDRAEALFRRASFAAVLIEPGAVVCCLAGAARMQPLTFCTLNVLGTAARLLLIRGLGALFPQQLDYVLGLVRLYQRWLLLGAVALTAAGAWRLLRLGGGGGAAAGAAAGAPAGGVAAQHTRAKVS